MIGNDIVDIELAKGQSNWKRARYLDKVFTLNEQNEIFSSKDNNLMVWKLWSMKEAAYKLYTQIYPSRFYNPKRFECSFAEGSTVTYGIFKCYVTTKITSNYIVSEAYLKHQKLRSRVIRFPADSLETQSEILRYQLLSLASKQLNCNKKDLQLVKQAYGIPTIAYKNKHYNVSLSHHGQFGTIAFAH